MISHEHRQNDERDEIDWNTPVQSAPVPTEAVLAAGVGPTVYWSRSTSEQHPAATDARE